ncbi:hypothetical protein N657DRAFT_652610 [Parathielavia appendiculata]|uniref:Allergen Asp f 4 n=1 Tax=Parathielavia appendiculata TaxID=2587402 RepID=A0AAN6UAG8_9PEZI|nr:hypothetical protein N657DRAFT_652610 [Parathielavia appendiculata]
MQLSNFALLAGVLGAAAHPSGHAHLHRSAKREAPAFVKAIHNKPLIPTTTQQASAASSSAAPATTAAAVSANTQSSESSEYIAFCGSSSKAKRVTYDQIMYKGNTGTSNGCTWNSNLMVVPNSIAKKYKYIQEYTNVASEPYQVVCANKMGADGQLTGMFKVAGQNPLIFTLQPGETKTVVADDNTQGVCAFAPNEVPTTTHGQYAGVWAEFDFANASNGGWSGADCSSLVAQAYNMDVPGCRMSEGGVDSTILPGGHGTNAYTKGMEALDGIGLNIVPGSTTIKVFVGFSG